MIKIFRKFRQNMIKENKTSKYVLYAIGEIILVVIGILIALSINNWNGNRKLQNEELNLLLDIKSDLVVTLKNLKTDSLDNHNYIIQYDKIEHYVYNDLPYSNELDSVFGVLTFWNSPYITSTAYKSLQSKGLDLIKNEKIKSDIINIYEVVYITLINDYDKAEWNLNQTVVTPFVAKHIRRINGKSLILARPNNFENLKQNEEFLNILSMVIRLRKRGLKFYREVINDTSNLIDEIETEINSRKL